MRILHVVEAPGQGTGRHVIDLSEALRDRGHDVHVVFSKGRISRDFLAELTAVDGIQIADIPMNRSIGWSDIAAGRALRRYARSQGPFDIIHGHSSKAGALARLVAATTGLRCVYTPHCLATFNPELSSAKRTFYGCIERALGHVTDGLIACSPEERASAVALGVSSAKIFMVPHGVRPPVVDPRSVVRARLGLSEQEVCLGFIGRFAPQKAPERVIRAFAAVQRRHSHTRLLMVGAGELEAQLRREAAELRIVDHVIWTGEIPSRRIFGAIDLLVSPSRYEGFSYTVLEATALGIPLIVSDAGGMHQAVDPDRNGIILPQGRDEAEFMSSLISALSRLVEQPTRRAAMAKASKDRSERFTVDRMVEQVLLIYTALCPPHVRMNRDVSGCPESRPKAAMRAGYPVLSDYGRLVGRRQPRSKLEPGLVSIVTVTKNAGATLERAIASVQSQSYPAVEHVIIDGGSSDGTAIIAKARLRPQDFWLSEPDLGISDAFNKGIALARGQYVQLLGADDWLSIDQVAVAVEVLATTGADFVFGDGIAYQGGSPVFRYHGDPNYAARIDRWMPVIVHPSLVARRAAYETYGLFNVGIRSAMDYDWLLRAHRSGAVGVHDPRLVSHIGLGGTHLQNYGRTMREVRDTAIAFGRARSSGQFEYGYHRIKHILARPLQHFAAPLYRSMRSWLNPAFEPIRSVDHSVFANPTPPAGEPSGDVSR